MPLVHTLVTWTLARQERLFKKSDLEKLRQTYAKNGIFGATRIAVHTLRRRLALQRAYQEGVAFDQTHNVQTTENVFYDGSNITYYEPTPINVLKTVLPLIGNDFSEYVFIDLGSGKGRVLLLASHFNFKKIVGIEFNGEMHQIARRNVRAYESIDQRCRSIETLCMDATEFNFSSEKCIIFTFNPFIPSILKKIIYNIDKSFMDNPRDMKLVFVNPSETNKVLEILNSSRTLRRRAIPGRKFVSLLSLEFPYDVAIYETPPPSAGDREGAA